MADRPNPIEFRIPRFHPKQDATRGRVGVRTRLLSIVLITSIALLTIGVGAAAYLVRVGRAATEWAELASSTTSPAISMVRSLEEERRLSLLYLAGDPGAANELAAARQRSDAALAAVNAKGDAARELNPEGSTAELEGYRTLFETVPVLRGGVDTRRVSREEVFTFFSGVIETIVSASILAARVAPDAGIGIELGHGIEPLRAAEALSKADTLGAVALTLGEPTPDRLTEFNRYVGEFRGEVAYSGTVLKGARAEQLRAITEGPAYRQVIAIQDAVMLRGPLSGVDSAPASEATARTPDSRATDEPPTPPVNVAAWQNASGQVISALLELWEDQSNAAHAIARQQGADTALRSVIGGALVLLITALAFLAALVLANRYIARMRRLRDETLRLANERLPEIMRRLDTGGTVDSSAEVSRLDFGTDELGQVADAFNRAHVAAVSAAVGEATTRAGFNTVFLNIAHRSQVTVHRQLALLDKAERQEEDPDQLELLFRLDHLATRARRHAENLIILGGEQPGRRWRKPVPLLELVRSAVAESLDYTRIHTGRVADVCILGNAVADLIHLLAELMDNATAFSPPDCRVDVTATVVGRGVAIEIIDQGLGMSRTELAERNRLLGEPPDFGVAALSDDTRLGLFVVATLAARHGISVRLGESIYGGIQAIVLLPVALTESDGPGAAEHPPLVPGPRPDGNPLGKRDTTPRIRPVESVPAGTDPVHDSAAAPISPDAAPAPPNSPTRPPLPRRRRTGPADDPDTSVIEAVRPRTADQARNLMSAIEHGTRQGRRPTTDSTATDPSPQEGDNDHFSAH